MKTYLFYDFYNSKLPFIVFGNMVLNQSYLGAHIIRGKRDINVYGKITAFGLLKYSGNVHTKVVPDCKNKAL